MNKLTVIDQQTGEIVGMPNDTDEIASMPIRLSWDVRHQQPSFSCDAGVSEDISGDLIQATHLYACWSDVVGQPTCMGVGKSCPDHPSSCEHGIGLILSTDQFGLVYLNCFGLMEGWGQGLVRRAQKNNGLFETSGAKVINTKHGQMRIPGLK